MEESFHMKVAKLIHENIVWYFDVQKCMDMIN